ncbi:metal-dependent hydrolase [Halobiforma nitratireducens]|uniref:Membrane-bound metal-dependent hydrolase n=1 Tax=Halobiforma nitratireducens JCM 10879 TaxID=1227454 RepID=M0M6I3_9EURY|nr:metal-dependent hydrolase [Halobiforma nitratireducens]EMA40229.1 membrane-bound metal-dependent hydrolase [Halobiforma nitratireducens JCM 10879]
MWPWGHVAVAYLLYTAYTHRRFDRPPLAAPAVALAVGSQFPDLIDKPLAWTVSVLPGGRTLGHSLLFAALLVPAVYVLATRLERRDVGIAFGIGHLSHLAADVPPSALTGDLSGTEFLLWPLVEQPPEEPVDGILDAILHYYAMGPYELVQFGLFALAAIVWFRDGAPGLEYARRLISSATDRRADRSG